MMLEKASLKVNELKKKNQEKLYARELLENKLKEEHSNVETLKQSGKDLKLHNEALKLELNALKKNLQSTEKEVIRLTYKSDNVEEKFTKK